MAIPPAKDFGGSTAIPKEVTQELFCRAAQDAEVKVLLSQTQYETYQKDIPSGGGGFGGFGGQGGGPGRRGN